MNEVLYKSFFRLVLPAVAGAVGMLLATAAPDLHVALCSGGL